MTFFLMYMAAGAIAGILAGLLGVGGGMVIVPMLTFVFAAQGMPHEHIMHLALGTSLASIVFTSISSLRAHSKRGAVIWPVVTKISPGILFGTFFGSWLASMLSTNFLKIFFAIYLLCMGTQMLFGKKPQGSKELPGTAGMFTAGSTIGVFSSLVGIGGGTLTVPFLAWHNTPLHSVIGTSSAIGLPIAIAGTAGYIVNGIGASGLPSGTIGYIQFSALFGVAGVSMLTAPIGAKIAHSLPVDKLKKIFALLLYVVGTKMLFGAL